MFYTNLIDYAYELERLSIVMFKMLLVVFYASGAYPVGVFLEMLSWQMADYIEQHGSISMQWQCSVHDSSTY